MASRAASLRLPGWAQDVALALFITVMQVQGTIARVSARDDPARALSDLGSLGYALLVVSGMALVVRRRWPYAVFLLTAAASIVYYAVDFPDGPGWLALFVALYTLAAYGDGRRSLLVGGAGVVVLATVWLGAAADIEPREAIGWVFFRIGASVMSLALGESVRSRRVIAAEAEERAARAERSREEEARARVDAERLRIAREVHDTVAHAIAIINVQAGVTAHVLDKRPERAQEALEVIEQTSSRALREMRTILGVLRGPDEGTELIPDLQQLEALTAQAREGGLEVELETTSTPAQLPSAVGSAAYRILQESLTNVIRHTGPTRVTVALDYGVEALEVRVTDDGRRAGMTRVDEPPGDGRGIAGMRERCRLLGGDLIAGSVPGGGFEVRARLPLAPTAVASR
jgi:signal transduction histidine kinase